MVFNTVLPKGKNKAKAPIKNCITKARPTVRQLMADRFDDNNKAVTNIRIIPTTLMTAVNLSLS